MHVLGCCTAAGNMERSMSFLTNNFVVRLLLPYLGTGVIHRYHEIVGPFRRPGGQRFDVQGGGHLVRRLRGRGPWLWANVFHAL